MTRTRAGKCAEHPQNGELAELLGCCDVFGRLDSIIGLLSALRDLSGLSSQASSGDELASVSSSSVSMPSLLRQESLHREQVSFD